MNTYRVSICVPRSKLPIIKLIRALTGWGLMKSKLFTEENFDFDEWLDNHATFGVVIGTHQMANLAHFCANDNHNHTQIVESDIVEAAVINPFDFTSV